MEHLVTCSYDGSVAVWEVRSGQGIQPTQLSRWTAHGPGSTSLLPSSLIHSSHSTPLQGHARKPLDTAAKGLEHLQLQTKDSSASRQSIDNQYTGHICLEMQQGRKPRSGSQQCMRFEDGTGQASRVTRTYSQTQSKPQIVTLKHRL